MELIDKWQLCWWRRLGWNYGSDADIPWTNSNYAGDAEIPWTNLNYAGDAEIPRTNHEAYLYSQSDSNPQHHSLFILEFFL